MGILIDILFFFWALFAHDSSESQTHVVPHEQAEEAKEEATTLTNSTALQHFLVDPFETQFGFSYVSGKAKEKVLERFGEPLEHTKSQYPDRTSDLVLTGHTYRYSGLTLTVGEEPLQPWSWLDSIEITGNMYTLKHDLKIGSSTEDVIAVFGQASFLDYGHELRSSAYVYQEEHGFELNITIEYDSEGHITAIRIDNFED